MISDHDFDKVLQVFDRPWAGYRKVRKGVKKRISRRMRIMGCTDCSTYLQLMESQPRERVLCEACLRVTISRFFRDRMLWQCLEERVLPDLLIRFPTGLKAWSAGCAGGEEPYSLAILWATMATTARLAILASDADPACLQRARRGRYGAGSLREVPEPVKNAYFTAQRPKNHFLIDPGLTRSIDWLQHDLVEPPPPGPFHLIFLRNNLLTYYQGRLLSKAFAGIVAELAPGGYLAVGSHERLPEHGLPLARDPQCPWLYQLAT